MLDAVLGMVDIEIVLRLLVAVGGGATIGLNRFLRRKSAGTRTHAIVALGSAMAVLMADHTTDAAAVSRVAQGLVTGVGFIGAGVILRHGDNHIQGLTTAASIWTCAIFGICSGAGNLTIAVTGLVLVLLVLLIGKPFEQSVKRLSHETGKAPTSDSASREPGDQGKSLE